MNRQPPPPPHCDFRAPSPTPCGAVRFAWPLLAGCSLLLAGNVCAQEGAHDERLQQLEARLAEQDRQIGALQQLVERQQHALDGLTREVGVSRLDDLRARGGTPALAQLPLRPRRLLDALVDRVPCEPAALPGDDARGAAPDR